MRVGIKTKDNPKPYQLRLPCVMRTSACWLRLKLRHRYATGKRPGANSPYSTFRRDGIAVVIVPASKLYSHGLLSALPKYVRTLPSPI